MQVVQLAQRLFLVAVACAGLAQCGGGAPTESSVDRWTGAAESTCGRWRLGALRVSRSIAVPTGQSSDYGIGPGYQWTAAHQFRSLVLVDTRTGDPREVFRSSNTIESGLPNLQIVDFAGPYAYVRAQLKLPGSDTANYVLLVNAKEETVEIIDFAAEAVDQGCARITAIGSVDEKGTLPVHAWVSTERNSSAEVWIRSPGGTYRKALPYGFMSHSEGGYDYYNRAAETMARLDRETLEVVAVSRDVIGDDRARRAARRRAKEDALRWLPHVESLRSLPERSAPERPFEVLRHP